MVVEAMAAGVPVIAMAEIDVTIAQTYERLRMIEARNAGIADLLRDWLRRRPSPG